MLEATVYRLGQQPRSQIDSRETVAYTVLCLHVEWIARGANAQKSDMDGIACPCLADVAIAKALDPPIVEHHARVVAPAAHLLGTPSCPEFDCAEAFHLTRFRTDVTCVVGGPLVPCASVCSESPALEFSIVKDSTRVVSTARDLFGSPPRTKKDSWQLIAHFPRLITSVDRRSRPNCRARHTQQGGEGSKRGDRGYGQRHRWNSMVPHAYDGNRPMADDARDACTTYASCHHPSI